MDKMCLDAIRVNKNLTREEFAKLLEISVDRYNRLVRKESKLLASELVKIHDLFEIDYEQIDF